MMRKRAVDGLLDRDLIDRENGSYLITGRFFRLWVQRVQLVRRVPLHASRLIRSGIQSATIRHFNSS
jgi:hypothetical protein